MSVLRQDNGQMSAHDASGPKAWDKCIKEFLCKAGLHETTRVFELEIVVMNSTFEKEVIPAALTELVHDLTDESVRDTRGLEERKVDYVQDSVHPVSPSALNRSISQMLARNRARNNVSNTLEFLRPTKRRRVGGDPTSMEVDGLAGEEDLTTPTSARTDAIKVDRDVQMKYEVATAAHGEGLLKRTVHSTSAASTSATARDHAGMVDDGQGNGGIKVAKGSKREIVLDPNMPTLERHPGLEERFRNIEDHLAVRYVPGPPEDIRLRLKSIEEHIIRLERDYPPWAALHFNQPRRTVSHPIQPTPIVIPAHLTTPVDPPPRSSEPQSSTASAGALLSSSLGSGVGRSMGGSSSRSAKGKERASGRQPSSLHRAVMEKLEIMKVKSENGGAGGSVG